MSDTAAPSTATSSSDDHAFEDARRAAGSGVAGLIAKVADQIGLHAGANAVFGEPIEQHGRTVVPVAQLIIGTGAGSGESGDAETGSGAGGGAVTRPLGYIEIGEEGTEFVPLRRPWQDPGLWVAGSVSLFVVARAIRALLRR